jgi:methylmalonyl-CoA/ethylmalonyl-CoA epimerase
VVIDHIGIVVRSIEQSLTHWGAVFGYRQQTEVVANTRQKVNVVFLTKPGSLPVKLIEPTDPGSPVFALAKQGGGLYHLCFRCESVDAEVARMRSVGLQILAPQQPVEAFENEKIAFV